MVDLLAAGAAGRSGLLRHRPRPADRPAGIPQRRLAARPRAGAAARSGFLQHQPDGRPAGGGRVASADRDRTRSRGRRSARAAGCERRGVSAGARAGGRHLGRRTPDCSRTPTRRYAASQHRQRWHRILSNDNPGDAMTRNLNLISHPLIQHKLTYMRSEETTTDNFRRLLREISQMLAYEVTRDLPTELVTIKTPLATIESPT